MTLIKPDRTIQRAGKITVTTASDMEAGVIRLFGGCLHRSVAQITGEATGSILVREPDKITDAWTITFV